MVESVDSIPNAIQAPETDAGDSPVSVEKLFEGKRVPPWREQLTVRAFVAGSVLTVLLAFIIMKLNLTTGVIPSFNVAAGLLGFLFVKTWTKVLEKSGLLPHPFTRQENTIIQTCVSAATSVAASGGFDTYLLGMTEIVAKQAPSDNDASNIKNLSLPWIFGFLLVVSFVGIFAVVPLRKILVIDLKLPYPSGTATAHLINSFHTPQGADLAKKQVKSLGKFFSLSFLWGFFQWFYTAGDGCGFVSFPTLGMKALDQTFYFSFSTTYIGIGMICPYIVNISMLVGAVLSWGIILPLISTRKGHWYDADLDDSSFKGLEAYKVFIFIAIVLGDGLFNFSLVLYHIIRRSYKKYRNKATIDIISSKASSSDPNESPTLSYDDQLRTRLFFKDQISTRMALVFYIVLAVISAITLPLIFHPLKWYYIVVLYIIAPALTFCNAYGAGLTDMPLAFAYTILIIFIIGSWAGPNHSGVIAGLAASSVIMNIAMSGCILMQDFRTGYMTLASPRSMFVTQLIGTLIGCGVSPLVFWVFCKAYPDMGSVGSTYPAPNALVTRNIAILGVEGFSALPKHCLTLCYIFFIGAVVINGIKVAGNKYNKKWVRLIPIPMAMALPFYLGAYFAIDMCVGSLILFIWRWRNKSEANNYSSAVASGLICGDGIWTIPESILALAGVKPPICMKFLSRRTNAKVDAFLGT